MPHDLMMNLMKISLFISFMLALMLGAGWVAVFICHWMQSRITKRK